MRVSLAMGAITLSMVVSVVGSLVVSEPGPPRAYPEVSCDEFVQATLTLGVDPGGDASPRVIRVTLPSDRPDPGAVRCGSHWLRTTGSFSPAGVSVAEDSTTTLLARPTARGEALVEAVCLACDDVGRPPDPESLTRWWLVLGALVRSLGLAALLVLWKRYLPPSLVPLFAAAPTLARGLSGDVSDRVETETLTEDPIPMPPEVGSRVALPSTALYRGGPQTTPTLRGPARVNGLLLARDETTPLADGDLVRVEGAAPVVVRLPGEGPSPLRYHAANEADRLRVVVREAPSLGVLAAHALSAVGVAASAGAIQFGPPSWAAVALLVGLLGLISGLVAPSLRGRYTIKTTTPRPEGTKRAWYDPDGELRLEVPTVDGGSVVASIPPESVWRSEEESALRRALVAEVSALARTP